MTPEGDLPASSPSHRFSRRQLLKSFGYLGAAAVIGGVVERAVTTGPAGADLGAVDHIVFLMMENRSYDHYFGAYHKGRGFDDHPAHSLGAFAQANPSGHALSPPGVLLPFHLDAFAGSESTDDLTHDWGPQHYCWNGGEMDSFVKVHTSPHYEGGHGALTMGYYERADLPFYYALADSFTLCDRYHASVLGPTHPNRLMANSGTIDPDGRNGGPVVVTSELPDAQWHCTWPTMQEVLQDAGVPWKVYHPTNQGLEGRYAGLAGYRSWSPELYDPLRNPAVMVQTDHILPYFTAFRNEKSPLFTKAFSPTFPNDFASDVRSDSLPSVSWIIPPLGFDDHPSSPPDNGMFFTSLVLDALTSNPKVWSKTVLVLTYDENDGLFDHVPPPTPPLGTPGEFLTVDSHRLRTLDENVGAITGPIGLGMRVPALVVSPFSRGGHVVSDVFDHTSQLQLIAARFGVEVPNVSAWRRRTVGDLTSTMFRGAADTRVPTLPTPSVQAADRAEHGHPQDAPSVPTHQTMPRQGGGAQPTSDYFHLVDDEIPGDARTVLGPPGPRPMTLKSSYNRLAD